MTNIEFKRLKKVNSIFRALMWKFFYRDELKQSIHQTFYHTNHSSSGFINFYKTHHKTYYFYHKLFHPYTTKKFLLINWGIKNCFYTQKYCIFEFKNSNTKTYNMIIILNFAYYITHSSGINSRHHGMCSKKIFYDDQFSCLFWFSHMYVPIYWESDTGFCLFNNVFLSLNLNKQNNNINDYYWNIIITTFKFF